MEQSRPKWGHFQFRIKWNRKDRVAFHIDLLLLDLIVAPTIEKFNKNDIEFWQCHRRATSDKAGHQFSLYVYTKPDIAKKIKAEIDDNLIYKDLLKDGHFEEELLFKTKGESLEYLSDNTWHPFIRKTWPHFIQGSTKMLLALIHEIKTDLKSKGELKEGNLKGLLSNYDKINDEIAKLWKTHFQHAFAHHLWAIFGYNDMLINSQLLTSI